MALNTPIIATPALITINASEIISGEKIGKRIFEIFLFIDIGIHYYHNCTWWWKIVVFINIIFNFFELLFQFIFHFIRVLTNKFFKPMINKFMGPIFLFNYFLLNFLCYLFQRFLFGRLPAACSWAAAASCACFAQALGLAKLAFGEDEH